TLRSKRRPIPGGVFIFVPPSLRAKRPVRRSSMSEGGSNPALAPRRRKLDCFVARAPRNDGERALITATDLPVGQKPVQPVAKMFRFASDPNHSYIHRRLVPQRGASRSSR